MKKQKTITYDEDDERFNNEELDYTIRNGMIIDL